MGGPSASVLLREPLNAGQLDQIDEAIRSVSDYIVPGNGYHCDFWVNDLRPLGGSYVGDGRPCGLAFYEPDEPASMIRQFDPEDASRLTAAIGFAMKQEVSLSAFCDDREDHAILGRLTLYVAELTGGLVYFSGAILPRLPEHCYKDGWLWGCNWSDVEPYLNSMAKDMPGWIVSITYEPNPQRTWAFHVADAAFLRAWLARPDFHMIK